MTIAIIPRGQLLGAEVCGVQIDRPLGEQTRRRLQSAWLEHLLLLFRDQALDDARQTVFTRQFGKLEKAPRSEITAHYGEFDTGSPDVTIVSNIEVNGKA